MGIFCSWHYHQHGFFSPLLPSPLLSSPLLPSPLSPFLSSFLSSLETGFHFVEADFKLATLLLPQHHKYYDCRHVTSSLVHLFLVSSHPPSCPPSLPASSILPPSLSNRVLCTLDWPWAQYVANENFDFSFSCVTSWVLGLHPAICVCTTKPTLSRQVLHQLSYTLCLFVLFYHQSCLGFYSMSFKCKQKRKKYWQNRRSDVSRGSLLKMSLSQP